MRSPILSLAPIALLSLGCTGDEPAPLGGGGSGGQDTGSHGGDPDPSTTHTGFLPDLLWVQGDQLLAADPIGGAVLRMDGPTGQTLESWTIGGSPTRIALSADGTQLAIAHGVDGPGQVDLLDLASGGIQTISLPEPYASADLAYGDDAELYMLLDLDHSYNDLAHIDPASGELAAVWTTSPLANGIATPETHGIAVASGQVLLGASAFDLPAGGETEATANHLRYQNNSVWGSHDLVLSGDGTVLLNEGTAIAEYERSTGTLVRTLAQDDWGAGEPEDHRLAQGGTVVVGMHIDFDTPELRGLDRASGTQQWVARASVPEPIAKTLYDYAYFVLGVNDTVAYVALHNDDGGVVLRVVLPID